LKKLIDLFTFKKLDWYVLKQYVGPFIITFLLAWFVLIMQFLWVYIDDLIGKGIDTENLLRFVWYTSSTLIPSALPLAILLSSIMTMGKFGENSELTSAKASGISLFRFFKSTIVFSIFVSLFAFYYSNYIFTKTKAVALTMLGDIRNLKPTLLIKPKQFYNGISGMSILIDSKDEKTGTLYGLKIYDHTKGNGNQSLLIARSAKMVQSNDGKVLIFRMDTGVMYKEVASNSYDDIKYPHYEWKFNSYDKRFDLTQFKLNENFNKNPEDARFSMNIAQLNVQMDSFKKLMKWKEVVFDTQFIKSNPSFQLSKSAPSLVNIKDSLAKLTKDESARFKIIVSNKLRSVKNNLFTYNSDVGYLRSNNQLLKVEWHRKFTLAISCLVLFFVGAPLGAIIKKGGIGLPMFISVILFIIYYMLTKIAGDFAQQEKVTPFVGMWFSTMLFLPFGIFLTYKAMNDSQIMNVEGFANWVIEKFSKKHVNSK
jgi:lipopolysaccharide export system permease protein